MERNRRAGAASGNGVVLATRRQRSRNPSDEEDKMEETSESRKRPKKDMYGLSTSYLSASANSLNKRKRWGMTGSHAEAHESMKEVKTEDGDVLSPLHLQNSRVQSKEDKFFMDISAVPRKRRSSISSSSRLTSMARKQQDLCFIQQQSPVMMLNGGSLPYGLFSQNRKKRLKPSSTELHAMKVSQVSDFSAVSDQEAEVAEALFVLGSSRPLCTGVLDFKLEAMLRTETKCASFSATPVVVPSSSGPDFASAGPKGKRPRVVAEKKEGKFPTVGVVYSASSPSELVHSSVGETELESALPRAHFLSGEANSFLSETVNSKIPAGSPHCVPRWPHHCKETMPRGLEEQCKDDSGAKRVKQETDMEERQPEVCIVKRTSNATKGNTVDSLGNHDEGLTKSSRSDDGHDCDGCISMSKITPTICNLEAMHENGGELSSHVVVKEDSVKGLNTGNVYLKVKGRVDGGIQGSNQEFKEQREQAMLETVRRPRDRDMKEEDHSSEPTPYRKNNDTGNSSVSSCFSSLSSTAVSRHAPMGLAGWMSGFSQLGYHGSAATSRAATSSLSMDMKAAMQLPHAAISSSVPKMKSCATHVYVAHYIRREQQVSLWSAALCRATTYNLNSPPVKPLDNDRPREAYTGFSQKAQTLQSSMQRMASGCSTHGSGVAGSITASNLLTSSRASSETSTVTASGHAMAAHAQYLQTIMQQSGVASLPYQVGQPNLIPHLQPMTQQAANVLPGQKQQQANGSSSSLVEQH